MTSVLPPIPSLDQIAAHSLFELPDGRHLAYMDWGDPGGFPTFYFHGTPSSRLEGAFAHAAACKHGLRLIATDRPGYGYSSFQRGRVFGDWPKDVSRLADALDFDTFGVAGHSGAGPHLFACGACIAPDRLRFIGALGPWGPVASPEIMADLNPLDRFYARVSRRMPWIMRTAFAPMGWGALYWPSLFFKIMKAAVSDADKACLENDAFLRHFRQMEQAAFRQGSRGAAHEASICFGAWDFDIADVAVPTYIWLGKDDIFVSNRMGQLLKNTIPGAELHLVQDKGHFNIENWDDIFGACAEHLS
ncbi:alpha/beta fold hydrolase [Roseobacter weihaiensis]|uniref:alpha/beta fold hydrolase n=1 Tax=Roseobacter weihaiensis TaxID=2763262 RepID=UPI0029CAB2D0|nr:alpha/beta hydrolase [Roseobacter sp. H9]